MAGATDAAEREALAALVVEDAGRSARNPDWDLRYEKEEKNGVKVVADLKAPPDKFAEFLAASVERWASGDDEAAVYAAAFGTSVANGWEWEHQADGLPLHRGEPAVPRRHGDNSSLGRCGLVVPVSIRRTCETSRQQPPLGSWRRAKLGADGECPQ